MINIQRFIEMLIERGQTDLAVQVVTAQLRAEGLKQMAFSVEKAAALLAGPRTVQ